MSKESERQAWAVNCLDLRGDEKVLELGCGHGVAVSLVCERLSSGRITAVDRSAKMIAAARRRNASFEANGMASFITASLHEAELDALQFDKVFGVHYPPLIRGSGQARELEVVRRHLAPGGRLYLPNYPLDPDAARASAAAVVRTLKAHRFEATEVRFEQVSTGTMYCVVAVPA